jgi:hypothetical protein
VLRGLTRPNIVRIQQKVRSTRRRIRALRRRNKAANFLLFAALVVMFALIGALADGSTGAIIFVVMFSVFSAVGAILAALISRSR